MEVIAIGLGIYILWILLKQRAFWVLKSTIKHIYRNSPGISIPTEIYWDVAKKYATDHNASYRDFRYGDGTQKYEWYDFSVQIDGSMVDVHFSKVGEVTDIKVG